MHSLLRSWLLMAVLALTPVINASDTKYTVAVIPKGTTHEFWKSIHAGAEKARQELSAQGVAVNLIWKGPFREDDRDQQIQVVESFIARRVNGIVLAPLDSQALVAPTETAVRAKIPVVIIDSSLKSEAPASYVATDNFKGGEMAAECLGKLLEGKGKVILLRYQVGSASTDLREAGFLKAMTSQFPNIQLLTTNQYAGATRDTAYQASQNILNRYAREADGVFCPNETSTIGMLLALRNVHKAGGTVKFVGFDANAQSVDALKKGDLQGLIVQNPFHMGYLGTMTLVRHLQGQKVDKVVDTGVTLVTPANMTDAAVQALLNPPIRQYLDK